MAKKFLIIDDSGTSRLILRNEIRRGFPLPSIDEAVDGEDAKEKLLAQRYDLAILDIDMPKKSGFSLLKEMKALRPEQKFIIVSSLSDSVYFSRAAELGASDFISKSNEMKFLVKAMKQVLDD